MTANQTRIAQAILITLQTMNAGLPALHLHPSLELGIASVLAGMTFLVHEAGVQAPPGK